MPESLTGVSGDADGSWRGEGAIEKRTTLVSVKDAGHPNKIQGHPKLSIRLDIQRLLTRQPRRKARRGVLPAREARVRDVEELRGYRGRRERVRVSDPSDEVLVDDPACAAAARRRLERGAHRADRPVGAVKLCGSPSGGCGGSEVDGFDAIIRVVLAAADAEANANWARLNNAGVSGAKSGQYARLVPGVRTWYFGTSLTLIQLRRSTITCEHSPTSLEQQNASGTMASQHK